MNKNCPKLFKKIQKSHQNCVRYNENLFRNQICKGCFLTNFEPGGYDSECRTIKSIEIFDINNDFFSQHLDSIESIEKDEENEMYRHELPAFS